MLLKHVCTEQVMKDRMHVPSLLLQILKKNSSIARYSTQFPQLSKRSAPFSTQPCSQTHILPKPQHPQHLFILLQPLHPLLHIPTLSPTYILLPTMRKNPLRTNIHLPHLPKQVTSNLRIRSYQLSHTLRALQHPSRTLDSDDLEVGSYFRSSAEVDRFGKDEIVGPTAWYIAIS